MSPARVRCATQLVQVALLVCCGQNSESGYDKERFSAFFRPVFVMRVSHVSGVTQSATRLVQKKGGVCLVGRRGWIGWSPGGFRQQGMGWAVSAGRRVVQGACICICWGVGWRMVVLVWLLDFARGHSQCVERLWMGRSLHHGAGEYILFQTIQNAFQAATRYSNRDHNAMSCLGINWRRSTACLDTQSASNIRRREVCECA